LGQRIAEVERRVRRSEHCWSLNPIDDAPVSRNESVTCITEEELPISNTCRQRVAVVEEPCGFTMQTDLIDPVTVPVADNGFVTNVADSRCSVDR
jgi:hypothetical protein